ncbi:MAG: MCE family protein [Deltaproteobacteria bacterium]|nr:MCE family protein [Deltaproteobacteria bacterium]
MALRRSSTTALLALVAVSACDGAMSGGDDDYVVVLRDARGLRARSPVFVAGIEAGEVARAGLVDGEAHVSFSLSQEHAALMTNAACASIGQHGLTGPMHIAIDPGTPEERRRARPIPAGGRIRCVRESTSERSMSEAAASAARILEQAATGEGTIGRLLRDPDLAARLERFLDRECTPSPASGDPDASEALGGADAGGAVP